MRLFPQHFSKKSVNPASSEAGSMSYVVGIVITFAIIVLLFGYWWVRHYYPEPAGLTPPGYRVMCTQDAKQCPNGSYVGRIGPKCEFAACPEDLHTK